MANLLDLQNQAKILERKIELLSASPILKDYCSITERELDNVNCAIVNEETIIMTVNALEAREYVHAPRYNNCVKEMSEATWLNPFCKGEPQSYEVYKTAYRDMQIADIEEKARICRVNEWACRIYKMNTVKIAEYLVDNNVELPL